MNTNLHPNDLIENKLGLSPELCPGIYGDLLMLLRAVKVARPENYDPTFETPVDDFLSRLESVGVPTTCIPFQKCRQILNEIRQKWIVGKRHG